MAIASKDLLLTRPEFAAALGVSETSVSRWRSAKGFNACHKAGKISTLSALRWLYNWKEEVSANKIDTASDAKKHWDAERSRVNYLQMIEELIPKAEYLAAEIERLTIVRDAVMSIPNQLSPQLNLDAAQTKLVVQTCRSAIQQAQTAIAAKEAQWIEAVNNKLTATPYAATDSDEILNDND